jgi:hypothetical protein
MSWEEVGRTRYPCPCGNGEYEEVHLSDDWGRSETHTSMLCPKCSVAYRHVQTGVYKDGPIFEWVPISTLEIASKERRERVQRAKSDCLRIWREKLGGLRTKKALWEVICSDEGGRHWRSYGTFLKDNRGKSLDDIRADSQELFESVSHHAAIYSICGVKNPYPAPNFLVENET